MADQDKTIYIGIELERQAQQAFNSSIDATASRLQTVFSQLRGTIKDDTAAVDDLRQSLNKAADEADNLQKASSGGFDLRVEGLRRTGGALTQLGLGEIGAPVTRAGDIAQVGKEIGLLKETIGDLGITSASTLVPLGAIGLALGGVAIVFKLVSDTLQKGREDVNAGIKQLETYYQTIEKGTTQTIKQQIALLEQEQDARAKSIAKIKEQIDSSQKQAEQATSGWFADLLFGGRAGEAGQLGVAVDQAVGPTKELSAELDKLTKESSDGQAAIDALKEALKSGAVAANDATQALLKQADATKAQSLQDYADSQLSADAAKKKAEQIKATIDADTAAIAQLQASGDQSQEIKDKIAALTKEAFDLDSELQKLNEVFIPAAENTERLAEAEKHRVEQLGELAKAGEEAQKVEDKRAQDLASAVAKVDADVEKITEQSAQKKLDIEKKYQDALIQAAERAAQQAEDELRRLNDERAKLQIGYNRGELDATRKAQYDDLTVQIKGQEEAAKSYREHVDKLRDIQRQAQQQQAQDILDRNFLALFQNQLSTRNAMEGENTSYGRSERERVISEQQSASDATRQRAFEHQQRLAAYETANADARRQYDIQLRENQVAEQRSVDQARRAKTQELTDLTSATNQALSIRHQGLIAELQLITQGETQKLAIQQQYYNRAMQLINASIRGLEGGTQIYNLGNSIPTGQLLQATAHQTMRLMRGLVGEGVRG